MKNQFIAGLIGLFLCGALAFTGCKKTTPSLVVPADSVPLPARGFYLGILPTPAQGQILDSAYGEVDVVRAIRPRYL